MELSIVLKATFIMALAIIVTQLARRARSAVRHVLLAATFAVLLILPIVSALMPPIVLKIPVADAAFSTSPTLDIAPLRIAIDPRVLVAPQAGPLTSRGISISTATVLRWAWFVGAITFLAPLVSGVWRLGRIRRRGLPWSQGDAIVRTIARDAGIGRSVVVVLHEDIPAPMTCGILRPTVVLPVDAPGWDERDLRQAIIHELEHVRRADWLTHVAARGVCALYWFHPFVWTAWRHLGLEAEQACDDAVLRGGERTAYAEQLLMLARRLSRGGAQPLLSMANRSDLRARISAVLDASRPRGRARAHQAAAIVAGAVVLVLGISPLRAVATSTRQGGSPPTVSGPTFEAASIKPNRSGDGRMGGAMQPGGRFMATNTTLGMLLAQAYRLQGGGRGGASNAQLVGAPSWVNSDHFDIVAKADANVTPDQFPELIKGLLIERFKLAAHKENRELPIYALLLARSDGKLGPGLRPVSADCAATLASRGRGVPLPGGPGGPGGPARGPIVPPPLPQPGERQPCGTMLIGPGTIAGGGGPISQLANSLSPWVNRIVLDRTGLTGSYAVDLTWTPDQIPQGRPGPGGPPPGAPPMPPIDPNGPSVFTAVQEQLGLKLESQRGPVEVLVIDRVERPSED